MKITKHANKRMKERGGLGKDARNRMAEKALTEGISHAETKGKLNKWVTSQFFYNCRANNIRLYGDKAYIFRDEVLITIVQIPSNLMKDFGKMIKRKE